MAYASLITLSQLLGHILDYRNKHSNIPLSDERKVLESLHEKSSFLQFFLDDYSHKGGQTVRSLEAKIRDAIYEAQDIIERHISNQIGTINEGRRVAKKSFSQSVLSIIRKKKKKFGIQSNCYKADLTKALEQINLILEEAMNIKKVMQSVEESQISTSQTPPLASSSQTRSTKNEMVEREEDLIAIQERLCGESSKLKIIPIVGMGGVGKTTLAQKVFDDSLIAYHFHTRAWATISQQHCLLGILRDILQSSTLRSEEVIGAIQRCYLPQTSDATLIEYVYRSLKGKRYLIVLDDMWSREAWDDLRLIFPDDNNGSRIIITTRLRNVAEHASSSSPIHQMHLLNDDESWHLLQEKVFDGDSCPPEFEKIGKIIAKNCGGLPLAILVVAGILTKVAMTQYQWRNVADNVSGAVATADKNFSKILSLSYNHLPNHLKTCFLYMGAFSEDYEIPVSNLIKLWVAEGFLKPIESKTLEEAAEEYLEDLVERNLVMMTKKTWTGKFRFCGMHDLLRGLFIQKAEEEKFLVVADRNVNSRGTDIAESRRLAICSGMEHKVSNDLLVRSILQFSYVWQLSSLVSCSRLLRVVAMPNAWLRSFPNELIEMFHLRYIAFTYNNIGQEPLVLPSTISKLQNLQTLIIQT